MAIFNARRLYALQKELRDLVEKQQHEMDELIVRLRTHNSVFSPGLFSSDMESIRVTRMRHQEEHGAVIQRIQQLFRDGNIVRSDDPIDGPCSETESKT